MTDVRALQVMLDGGVTDPNALLAALPSGTTDDVQRAVDELSAQALEPDDEMTAEDIAYERDAFRYGMDGNGAL